MVQLHDLIRPEGEVAQGDAAQQPLALLLCHATADRQLEMRL